LFSLSARESRHLALGLTTERKTLVPGQDLQEEREWRKFETGET
jgi:hypothetical protein